MTGRADGVVVVGVGRSGTSAIAGMCHKLGYNMGEDLLPPAPDNPWGFFEDRTVVELNDQLLIAAGFSWDNPPPGGSIEGYELSFETGNLQDHQVKMMLHAARIQQRPFWGIKDPRLCFLLPEWGRYLGQGWRITVCHRKPREAEDSHRRRDPYAPTDWAEVVDRYRKGLRGLQRYYNGRRPILHVPFNRVKADPVFWAGNISSFLGGPQDGPQVKDAAAHIRRSNER